ncbi:hypothetical protein KW842_25735 [Duganella sp. sic0402]|uniref:hypothetical protein n=1 Tax=Duganella sp. sic0402 TaxID=2854786 RepID=UPI001C483CF9|nr:hypothetical protein [Duganella sp. sic0402]MBV7539175.1 hypothetical protein [Duganella sp. sic0402]
MNPTSLDKQSGAADDGNIVRIVRLETQMDNVSIALTSLQRTVEQNHRESMMRFDDMRGHMEALHQKSMDRMDGIHQKSMDRMDGLHQKSTDRMDSYVRWMVGIMVAHIIATAGILVRMFMS